MPGENSISFKVYIVEGNENVETRRFEVDQGVVTNYDYIRERLQYVFPRLRGNLFKILWKDSEEDEVTISSDEEMMIALSEIKSDLCKLIIRLPSEENTSEERMFPISLTSCPAFGDINDNGICSSCQKQIQGFRYRCLECFQYNQCSDCEHKSFHPDHLMLRLNQNYPTLISLIPKGMNILKQHLMRGSKCGKGFFMHGEPSRREESSKGKCGGHHRRRYRKSHSSSEKKNGTENQNEPEFNLVGDIEQLVSSFISMFPKSPVQLQKQDMDTDDSSSQEENAAGPQMPDGPPEPVNIKKDAAKSAEASNESNAGTSSKTTNPNIVQAVKILTDMGFKNEGQWLSNILERFDGDITKALDHLMQLQK